MLFVVILGREAEEVVAVEAAKGATPPPVGLCTLPCVCV